MKEVKVKKYRGIVRRMMERLSENGKDWAKPRSTVIQAYKPPPCDQMHSSGRRNLDGGADQQLSMFPSEKEQIQKQKKQRMRKHPLLFLFPDLWAVSNILEQMECQWKLWSIRMQSDLSGILKRKPSTACPLPLFSTGTSRDTRCHRSF